MKTIILTFLLFLAWENFSIAQTASQETVNSEDTNAPVDTEDSDADDDLDLDDLGDDEDSDDSSDDETDKKS